jgi:hypothetical protein
MSSLLPFNNRDASPAPLPFSAEARIERDLRRDVKNTNADIIRQLVRIEAGEIKGKALIEAAVEVEVHTVEGRKQVGRAYEAAAADAGPITQHLLAEAIGESSQHLRNATNRAHRGLLES